jgi:hypothetical protein
VVVVDGAVVDGGAAKPCAVGSASPMPNAMTAPPLPARSAATAATPTSRRCREPTRALPCRAIYTSQTVHFGSDGATPYARWAMTTTFRVVVSSRPVSR